MPRFQVRTEDPNSDEFRVYRLVADDVLAARKAVRANEAKLAAFLLSHDDLVALLGDKVADLEPFELDAAVAAIDLDTLRGGQRGRVHMHRQTEPYKVIEVRNLTDDPGRQR